MGLFDLFASSGSSKARGSGGSGQHAGVLDGPVTKAQLKMACSRSKIMRNKTTQVTKQLQREVALLLRDGQESRAKIKAEQILQNINLCDALDLVDTMAELLATRIQFLCEQRECPPDLVQTVSSLLYASGRCPVEELDKVAAQFRGKYGEDFVQRAKNGLPSSAGATSAVVHPRLVKLLSVQPPTNKEMVSILRDAATYYRIEWEPSEDLVRESTEPLDLLDLELDPVASAPTVILPSLQEQHQQPHYDYAAGAAPSSGPLAPAQPGFDAGAPSMVIQTGSSFGGAGHVSSAASSTGSSPHEDVVMSVSSSQPFVTAVIPAGYSAGMTLEIQTPDHRQLSCVLPANSTAGMTIQVPYMVSSIPAPAEPVFGGPPVTFTPGASTSKEGGRVAGSLPGVAIDPAILGYQAQMIDGTEDRLLSGCSEQKSSEVVPPGDGAQPPPVSGVELDDLTQRLNALKAVK
eukprot:g846.t1